MELRCASCGHTGPAASVDVEDGVVWVACAACGARSALAPATQPAARKAGAPSVSSASPPPTAVPRSFTPPSNGAAAAPPAAPPRDTGSGGAAAPLPPVKCPKCGHRQYDTHACHKCGLVFARVADGRRPWDTAPKGQEGAYAAAAEAWRRLEADFDNPDAHAEFLDRCRKSRASAYAAMRYRHVLSDHPDHALAQQGLARATNDATVVVQSLARTEAGDVKRQARNLRTAMLLVLGVMGLGVAALGVIVMLRAALFAP